VFRRKSRSPAENEVVGRKIKTSAGFSVFSLKIQKFSGRSETSRTRKKVPGLRRISSDSFEFPADDSDFQPKGRNAATNSSKPQESAIFRRAFDRRSAAEKILSRFEMSSDSFVLAADKSRISLTTI